MSKLKKVFNLAGVSLKSVDFSIGSKKKGIGKCIWIIAALIAVVTSAMGTYMVSSMLYKYLNSRGIPDAMLEYALVIAALIAFAFSLVMVKSVLYSSKDNEQYMSLPVGIGKLLSGKFLSVVILQLAVSLVALIPALYYGIKESMGVVFYIYSVLVYLCIPVATMFISSILIMLVKKVFKKCNKTVFNIFSILFFIAIALVAFVIYDKVGGSPEGRIVAAIQNNLDLLGTVGLWLFPGLILASRALALSASITGLIYMIAFILVTVIEFLILVLLANVLYVNNKKKSN